VKYMIAQASSAKELEEKVTRLLEEGWEPLGGISISVSKTQNEEYAIWVEWWAQAMVIR